jgi:tetratricopeptide (TPR) repeat protein
MSISRTRITLTIMLCVVCLAFAAVATADPLETFHAGLEAAKKGDNAAAVSLFTEALASGQVPQEDRAVVHLARGISYSQMERLNDALTDFNAALQIRPDYGEAYLNRGAIFLTMGRFQNAVEDFDKGLGLLPDVVVVYNDRGFAHENMKNYAKARADYQQALALDPNFGPASFNLAKLLATCEDASIRDGKRAVELAKQAMHLEVHADYELHSLLAAAQAEAGDFDAAVNSMRRAIDSLPPNSEQVKQGFEAMMRFFQQNKAPWRQP